MATFKTIHTTYGLTRMAAAEASGTPINLTHIAVGDGNGNPVFPSESQTLLAREMYRAAPNRIYQDPATPTLFTAELVVPASVGGFTLREVGIFDDAGGLYAVGNLPDTYKPNASEGAYADTVVRVQFAVSNAGVVTLQLDPSVAVATQAWINNNVTIGKLLPGGLTGQVLAKDSNADGDASWHDPTDVNVVVDTIEEKQTLAASQVQVDLALTNTNGLAVYIEGVRLPKYEIGTTLQADGWQPDATVVTRLHLGQSYPAASQLIAVQNEPASHITTALQRDQNLADVPDKATARTNLDVYSKAETNQLVSPGDIKYTASASAPSGWLKANGAAVNRTAYAALFAVIGTTYGAGDGFNTFNLPDLRGEFIRGFDDGRGVDAGRTLGSAQAGQNLSHSHGGSTDSSGSHSHGFTDSGAIISAGNSGTGGSTPVTLPTSYSKTTDVDGSHSHGISTSASGGNEARPRNIALLACIKF